MNWTDIIWAVVWFAVLGAALGLILAFAGKVFAVKKDERIGQIVELLPGANCGGCGYAGCSALAEAIVKGEAKPDACAGADPENTVKIGAIMGVDTSNVVKMRAQVMCSGTHDLAHGHRHIEDFCDLLAAHAVKAQKVFSLHAHVVYTAFLLYAYFLS